MPIKFSKRFNVDHEDLMKEEIFDAFIDLDTRFYIHPLLLKNTKAAQLHNSYQKLQERLSEFILIINSINEFNKNDVSYREIVRRFSFDEPPGLCIGYSEFGTDGTGLKGKHALQIIESIFQIKNKSLITPELLELLPFVEEGIGPDRLSDMVANIIEEDIAAFTQSIVKKYNISETKNIIFNDNRYEVPWLVDKQRFILILPQDILENLPIANSYDDIDEVVNHNRELREIYNELFKQASKNKTQPGRKTVKKVIKDEIMHNEKILFDLIESYRNSRKESYCFANDPLNEINWSEDAHYFFEHYLKKEIISERKVDDVVNFLLNKFKDYTELNGLNKAFLSEKETIKERIPQRVFQALSQLYIDDKNIDINPEVNLGPGQVDFKFSRGSEKVIIEMKISSNPSLISGLTQQLTAYYDAEKPLKAYYVVLYNKENETKKEELNKRLDKLREQKYKIDIIHIDSSKKESASKRKEPTLFECRN